MTRTNIATLISTSNAEVVTMKMIATMARVNSVIEHGTRPGSADEMIKALKNLTKCITDIDDTVGKFDIQFSAQSIWQKAAERLELACDPAKGIGRSKIMELNDSMDEKKNRLIQSLETLQREKNQTFPIRIATLDKKIALFEILLAQLIYMEGDKVFLECQTTEEIEKGIRILVRAVQECTKRLIEDITILINQIEKGKHAVT